MIAPGRALDPNWPSEGGVIMAEKNIFAQAEKLQSVSERLVYTNALSDKEKKKNEYLGSYDTISQSKDVAFDYWNQLAEYNQQQFRKSSNFGRTYIDSKGEVKEYQCIEAREMIVELPNEFFNRRKQLDYAVIAKAIAEFYKKKFGCECNVAIHINKDKTNLHAHIIFSERNVLLEKKIASRNLFFDENGKRRYKKSEILNEDKTIREGCKIVPKGSELTEFTFTGKNSYLKSNAFTAENKEVFAKEWNKLLQVDKYQVFDRSDVFLAQKKIKKSYGSETKARLKEENKTISEYNQVAKELLDQGYEKEKLRGMKKNVLEGSQSPYNDLSADYHRRFMQELRAAIKALKERLKEFKRSLESIIFRSSEKAEETNMDRAHGRKKRDRDER